MLPDGSVARMTFGFTSLLLHAQGLIISVYHILSLALSFYLSLQFSSPCLLHTSVLESHLLCILEPLIDHSLLFIFLNSLFDNPNICIRTQSSFVLLLCPSCEVLSFLLAYLIFFFSWRWHNRKWGNHTCSIIIYFSSQWLQWRDKVALSSIIKHIIKFIYAYSYLFPQQFQKQRVIVSSTIKYKFQLIYNYSAQICTFC